MHCVQMYYLNFEKGPSELVNSSHVIFPSVDKSKFRNTWSGLDTPRNDENIENVSLVSIHSLQSFPAKELKRRGANIVHCDFEMIKEE